MTGRPTVSRAKRVFAEYGARSAEYGVRSAERGVGDAARACRARGVRVRYPRSRAAVFVGIARDEASSIEPIESIESIESRAGARLDRAFSRSKARVFKPQARPVDETTIGTNRIDRTSHRVTAQTFGITAFLPVFARAHSEFVGGLVPRRRLAW